MRNDMDGSKDLIGFEVDDETYMMVEDYAQECGISLVKATRILLKKGLMADKAFMSRYGQLVHKL